MIMRGVKSITAAALATGLVGFFVATSQEPLTTMPVAPEPAPFVAQPQIDRDAEI